MLGRTRHGKRDKSAIREGLNAFPMSWILSPRQCHGTACIPGKRIWALPWRPCADGIILQTGEVWGTLQFADCFPVAVTSAVPFRWIALVHAGYRGVVKKVLSSVLGTLRQRFGPAALRTSEVWIGPGIGACCYSRELDDPWTRRGMQNLGGELWSRKGRHVFFDLARALRTQCRDAGVPSKRISTVSLCTQCNRSQFFSYRGGDTVSRNILFAKITGLDDHKPLAFWENVLKG
ncbi:MAG: polyphenol oxidase family protein [Synergistales bacterium]|nr:polyphenol oxidase family protein [Synergistales bacterium]